VEKRRAHPNVIVFVSSTLEEKIKIINQGDASSKESEEDNKVEEEILNVKQEHQTMLVEHERVLKEHKHQNKT
jgi:hypothetical protein